MKIQVVTREDHENDTDPYHWARIKGDNGEIVWSTETYTRKEAAYDAIGLLGELFGVTAAAPPNVVIEEVVE